MESLKELMRPWKLFTLAVGLTLLVAGSFYFNAPDWDVSISLIMAAVAYLTASWCMHTIVERRWRDWPLMIFLTWFGVDGCYWLYWSWKDPIALDLMRDVNALASLLLFWSCGLIWYFRGSMEDAHKLICAFFKGSLK